MLWLATVAASRAWADLHARSAAHGQERLQQSAGALGQVVRYRDWQAVHDELQMTLSLDPGNPSLRRQAADLLAIPLKDGDRYRSFLDESRNEATKAAILRPGFAYEWSNLATAKYRLGEIDPVLFRSLQNAAMLGPWEPPVQWEVIDTGFAVWDQLPKPVQENVLALARNGARHYPNEVLNIAQRRGRLELVCGSAILGKMSQCREGTSELVIPGNNMGAV
ncbi:MAG: hypothetical protein HY255_06970 [Betaproteobacteria bacterium]|nr:hypothetical protein [Betaproteobacteria bacterium]